MPYFAMTIATAFFVLWSHMAPAAQHPEAFPETQIATEATTIKVADRRSRERRSSHRVRNATIAAILLLDGEYERCLQEYVIHYGDNVAQGCLDDLMAYEGIPLDIRQQWHQQRFSTE